MKTSIKLLLLILSLNLLVTFCVTSNLEFKKIFYFFSIYGILRHLLYLYEDLF